MSTGVFWTVWHIHILDPQIRHEFINKIFIQNNFTQHLQNEWINNLLLLPLQKYSNKTIDIKPKQNDYKVLILQSYITSHNYLNVVY